MSNIHSTVMLGSLSISFPEMRRNAKEEAVQIERAAQAKAGTLTAAKHAMVGVVKHKTVKDYAAATRSWWNKVTLPWFDGRGAPRAVAAMAILDLKIELGDRRRTYLELVEDFMSDYPIIRAQQQFDMGDLFDPRMFPAPDVLRRKFDFRSDWYTLPDANDIRVIEGIDSAELARIQKEAAASEQRRLADAMGAVAQRLHKVVKSMHDTMATPIGDKGAKFNDTKLENILEIADLIPSLNLTGDPELAKMAKLARKLATKAPGELREDAVKRADAAKEAASLAAKLQGMFSADAGEDDE